MLRNSMASRKAIGTGMMFSRITWSAIIASMIGFATPAAADLTWGVNGHPLISYPDVTIEQQLDYVKDLGMKSYRVDIPNGTKAPQLRKLIMAAKAREIEILPVITPDFNMDALSPDVLHKQAYDLGFGLASQFKGEIRVWELANEFENYAILKPCEMRDNGVQYSCSFGSPGGSDPLDYYGPRWAKAIAVVKGLTEGVRAADPKTLRAVGTAGWGHIGAFERMFNDGANWEISVWHMYGQDPEWALKKLVKYGHPIWITEFNHPLGSTSSEKEQADGLANTMAMLRRYQPTYNIQAAHIYELLDEPYWAPNYEAYMGLIRIEKSDADQAPVTVPKLAYKRVKELISAEAPSTGTQVGVAAKPDRKCTLRAPFPRTNVSPKEAITYSYCLVLDRDADGAGLSGWTSKLAEGMPITELLTMMLSSDEFERTNNVSTLSQKQYVTLLYKRLLGQDPEASVLEKTAHAIEQGTLTRTDFQKSLIESPQFKSLHNVLTRRLSFSPKPSALPTRTCTLPTLRAEPMTRRFQIGYGYCLVLGRQPEISGLNSYNLAMLNGLSMSDFLLGLLQSSEFKKKYEIDQFDNDALVTFAYSLLLDREPDAEGLKSYVANLHSGTMNRSQLWQAVLASEEFRTKHLALFVAVSAAARPPADAQVSPDQ